MRTRIGKIARLPENVREELNRRLLNGASGKEMTAWLNELPEVQQVLRERFEGRAISEHNVSEWRLGGFQEWIQREEKRERVRQITEEYDKFGSDEGISELERRMKLVILADLAEAMVGLSKIKNSEARWKQFQKFSRELCRLQNAHSWDRATRLQEAKASRAL